MVTANRLARHFDGLPSLQRSRELLREISRQASDFSPVPATPPLLLYGAGALGKMAYDYCTQLNIPVAGVVDAHPELRRADPEWSGVSIQHWQEVSPADRRSALLAVCVVTHPFTEVIAPLEDAGWGRIVPFYDIAEAYRGRHPLSNGWHAGVLTPEDMEHIDTALDGWSDGVSRAHHLQFIAWRAARQEWLFRDAPIQSDDRFFVPEVLAALGSDEVFVDVGAHHGHVCSRFVEAQGGRYRLLVAVEPDVASHAVLRSRLGALPGWGEGRIRTEPVALAAESGEQAFCSGLGYASQLSALGKGGVPVRTLDSLELPATFIKLHVEGAEPEVLAGAMATIERHRPILCLTAYHARSGLWRLPLQLMESLSGYQYLFRLHGWCGTGAVLYAVPQERAEIAGVDL